MPPLIAAWMMLFAADVTEVHRCVGDDGVPRYQDQPCASGESQQHLRLQAPPPVAPAAEIAAPEVDNGEVYYRHDGCPDVLSEPLWLSMPDRSGYSTWMQVRAVPVQRSFACRQISRGGRYGAERDQRAAPYDKLSGRDLCR